MKIFAAPPERQFFPLVQTFKTFIYLCFLMCFFHNNVSYPSVLQVKKATWPSRGWTSCTLRCRRRFIRTRRPRSRIYRRQAWTLNRLRVFAFSPAWRISEILNLWEKKPKGRVQSRLKDLFSSGWINKKWLWYYFFIKRANLFIEKTHRWDFCRRFKIISASPVSGFTLRSTNLHVFLY